MNCMDVRDSLESYISGDLDDTAASAVAEHLRTCDECTARYDRMRGLIGDLKGLKTAFVPREVFDMSYATRGAAGGSAWIWKLSTAFAALLALLAVSALTVPAVAAVLPSLPVTERLSTLEAENERLTDQVEELEIKIQQIEGTQVPVVETAEPTLSPEINAAVQSLVMRFVRAQYAGDIETMRALGTDKLDADLAQQKIKQAVAWVEDPTPDHRYCHP